MIKTMAFLSEMAAVLELVTVQETTDERVASTVASSVAGDFHS